MSSSTEIQSVRRSPRRWWTIITSLGITTVVVLVLALFGLAVYVGNHPNRQLFYDIQRYGSLEAHNGEPPEWAEDSMLASIFVTPTEVRFNSPAMDDAALERVSRRLGTLVQLALMETSVSDAGLRHLANMPKLEVLDLSGPHLTGSGLQWLGKLPRLRRLTLRNIPATGDDFAALKACTALEDVKLYGIPIGDGLRHLPCRRLRQLAIWDATLADADAPALGAMPNLVSVTMKSTQLNDAGAATLLASGNLEQLALADCPWTGACFENCPAQPNLHSVNFAATAFSDEAAIAMCRQPSLRDVALPRTRITDASLPHLAGLTELNYLNLADTRITDAGLEHLCRLEFLRLLDLSFTEVRGTPLGLLAGSEYLIRLDLTGTKVGDDQLPAIALLQPESVSLSGTQVTTAGVTWLQEQLPDSVIDHDPDATRESLIEGIYTDELDWGEMFDR
jgi:hypothetical protein